ncbi:MAG: transcriptional regulator protein [Methanobacteriota archaeon]
MHTDTIIRENPRYPRHPCSINSNLNFYENLEIKQLDEKEEEIADALMSLGMNRPVARTLAYLNNGDETTSVALEMGTGLRQPEVSIVMRQLKDRDWINEREEKKTGKGRPYKIYSLKIGFNEIIVQLESQQIKAVDEAQEKIKQLKDLGK